MKDLLMKLKYSRDEYKIISIIENDCEEVITSNGTKSFGKKSKDTGTILYWKQYNKELSISERNIINSGLFNNFVIEEVVSVINKYCKVKIDHVSNY